MTRPIQWILFQLSRERIQFLILLLLLFLCGYRATILSMTHDESATWLYAHEWNVLTTLFTPEAWGTANNHFLNTLLLKINNQLFGNGDFQSRLHSVISFLLMGYWAIKLIKLLYKTKVAQALAFTFIVFNLYLFDFFSLARGYAGAITFLMGSILYLYRYLDTFYTRDLLITYSLLSISSLFLFTHLIFIPIFSSIVWVYIFRKKQDMQRKYSGVMIPIIFMILMTILLYTPLSALQNNAEFSWGSENLLTSLKDIIKNTFYNHNFLGKYTYEIMGITLLILCCNVIWNTFIQQNESSLKILITIFLLLISTLVMAHLIFNIQFPINRKGLLYIPFISFIVAGLFEQNKHQKIKSLSGFILICLFIIQFILNLNFNKVQEWYYDYNTKNFIQAVIIDAGSRPSTLATHWAFHWTAKYYLQTNKTKHLITQKPYSKNIDTTQIYDYYLVEQKHLNQMDSRYKPLTNYDSYQNVVLTSR